MKKRAPVLALLCLALSLSASGCVTRAAAARMGEERAAPSAVPVMAQTAGETLTPAPETVPTPEPTATPCPHGTWSDGVCADCGETCSHEEWESGRCLRCGTVCPHPAHDGETLLCTRCGERALHTYEKGVCTLCGETPVFVTDTLPRELFEPCERRGSVETLEYTTLAYSPVTRTGIIPTETEKALTVYLPYGYDPAEKYDLLILLHGIRCTERYWLVDEQEYAPGTFDPVFTRDLLDNLIDRGHSRPVIVAAPTFYRDSGNMDSYDRKMDQPRFLRELREDILPLLLRTYSTWAEGDTLKDAAAQREHFAFAGLSMGSIYGITSILPQSLDVFGYLGCFSGSDGYMDQIADVLNDDTEGKRPIYYFYNSIGSRDPYFYLHRGQYQELVELAEGLTDGENAAFTEIKDAMHQYNAWSAGLYNFLGVAFSRPET